jgi:hypothetical protein
MYDGRTSGRRWEVVCSIAGESEQRLPLIRRVGGLSTYIPLRRHLSIALVPEV